MAQIRGAQISKNGQLCRINYVDETGHPLSLTFEVDAVPQLMASLAECAKQAQTARGSEEIPFFPAQTIAVRQRPDRDYVLVTFGIDPGMEMTFSIDKPSLRKAIGDLSAFLEEGPGGARSSHIH